MSKDARQTAILQRLKADVAVRISALAGEFGVTGETVRRDLDDLAARGLVARTYGGAAMRSLAAEPGLAARAQALIPERQRIAALAAALVSDGDVLMIDAGSTTSHFAEGLARRNIGLTVITNSLAVARALGSVETVGVLLAPGDYRFTEDAVYGPETLGFLDRYRADYAFIGAGGFTRHEVSDADAAAAFVKRRMTGRARMSYLLADSGKAGMAQFAGVCALDALDGLVTDAPLEAAMAQACAAAGIAVHVAAEAAA